MENWTYKKSRDFYNIQGWGNSYFNISPSGSVTVKRGKYLADKPVVIHDIVEQARLDGFTTPLILRFTDIIQNRTLRITRSFSDMIKKLNYSSNYTLIYPIKANQNKSVIDSFIGTKTTNCGLEAGSKPELLAVLALVNNNKTPIICNGYKDSQYIKAALIARKLGRNITIVIEKMPEALTVLKLSKELDVEPLLGVRFRLALTLSGKWAHSGGEKSKFGLNTTQALDLISLLEKNNLAHTLHLLHCHQGSQIANIKDIEHYINELGMVYAELYKLGAPIKIVDIGGGLAVDYEGSRTRGFNSTNYSLGEYAETIIATLKVVASTYMVPEPQIFSESGRAVTAHHAVFVTDIVEVESIVGEEVPIVKSQDEDLLELENLFESFNKLPINEIYSSSVVAIENIHNRFNQGQLSIKKRAIAEQLFSHIKLKVLTLLNRSYRSHRELYDLLDEDLAKKVFANFSLFASMPDSWAISQLFPIMPLTQLNHEPTMRSIIEDLTCDSDGQIRQYIDYQGNEPSLKLPPYKADDPYLLAVFLVGTYQEIMGNLHNLFGPVTALDISLDGKGGFNIDKIHCGFNNSDSLNRVGFNAESMYKIFSKQLGRSKLPKKVQNKLLKDMDDILQSQTYLQ